MNINTSSLLSFLEPKLTNNIKSKINALSVDGKVDLGLALKDKSLQSILNNLFKDILTNIKSKSTVNNLLTNSKNLLDLKNIPQDIKAIIVQTAKNPVLIEQNKQLKSFLLDIKNLDEKSIKTAISNSGVFLESKLLKNEQNPSSDLKAVLLQLSKEIDDPRINKIISQIEYHQLLSFTSYSNNTFLPFLWDNVEDGSVDISSNNKEQFTCNIHLKLKEYGELKAMLLLEKSNTLTLNMRIEDKSFKNKIQNNLQLLRQKLNNIAINISSINILSLNEEKSYEKKAYESNNTISYGTDIKA